MSNPESIAAGASDPRPRGLTHRDPLWAQLLLILLAVIPFQLLHVGPVLYPEGEATGFILYDMPYYVANGREVFERGNGCTYPNPYDADEDAPAIYFHWLLWGLGFGTVYLGLDPGVLFAAMGMVGSFLMAGMTWMLIRSLLPDRRWRKTLFLFAMWGGGLLCFGKLFANIAGGQLPWEDLLAYDTHRGLWVFSWGRNSIYPTESVYHFLAITSWYFMFHRRHGRALVMAGLLAATHPWSGLEVLAGLTAFFGVRALVLANRSAWGAAISATCMLVVFLGYNMWFLNQFEAHRAVYAIWQINWSLERITLLLAYAPIAIICLLGAFARKSPRSVSSTSAVYFSEPTEWQWFLMTCFACGLLLATHDRFVTHPKQPLHFTRGFVWMPLCLLALPYLQQRLISTRHWRMRPAGIAVVVLLVGSWDNFVFLTASIHSFASRRWDAQTLRHAQRDVLDWMDHHCHRGLLASSDEMVGYLSATYTSVNPFVGHKFNTPDRAARKARQDRWLSGTPDADLQSRIDYVLLTSRERSQFPLGDAWETRYENEGFVLLENRKSRTHGSVRGHDRETGTRRKPFLSPITPGTSKEIVTAP